MCKRPLQMVVYDDTAAGESRCETKRPRSSAADADAGAMVVYDAVEPVDVEPIHAMPLQAIAPQLPPAPAAAPAPAIKEEPLCLRTAMLKKLKLEGDLPVHFIGEKRVRDTDLKAQQNRFRIPTDCVQRRLRNILTPGELEVANLLHDPAPRPRRQPEPARSQTASPSALTLGVMEQGKEIKKRRTGKVHGGLPVMLVDLAAGASGGLLLSRWDSSGGTVVKGEKYIDFIQRCSFKENDVVDIWAFQGHKSLRLLGQDVLKKSPLCLLIVKRDDTHHNCRYCNGH